MNHQQGVVLGMVGLILAVVPLGSHEAQLGVSEDVVVCTTHPVLGRAHQEVPVVRARLPPYGQFRGWLAQGQALEKLRVAQDLLPDLPEKLYPVQCTRRTLLSDGLDGQ